MLAVDASEDNTKFWCLETPKLCGQLSDMYEKGAQLRPDSPCSLQFAIQ